jgi:hypothetical protein
MAEVKIALLPTGMTYSRNTKAPLEDKRIFNTLALAQEYVNDVDQTAYVGLTISVVNDGVNNGLYYIERIADANNATGLLVKIGSDSAADVANLQSDVATLKATVGDSTSGLVADVAGKADAFTAGDGIDYTDNVVKVAISATEGNSLSVNSDGLYVAVPEIEVPEYTLESVSDPDSAYASQYQLKKDGVAVGATINIPKDQFLKDASFHATAEDGVAVEAPYLKFVWDLDINEDLEGIQNVTYVPVKDLVDTYTAGDYIQINDANAISLNLVKLSLDLGLNDKFAQIEANTTAIGDANSGLVADVAKNTSDIETLNTNYKNLRSSVTALENLDVVNGIDDTATHGIGLTSTTDADGKVTAKVSVDINKLATAVIAKHEIPTPVASEINVSDFGTYKDSNVQAVLENLDTRITAAAGGGIQSIVTNPGSGIAVDSSDVNNPAISINIEEDSALTINENNKIDLVWSEL